MALKTVLAQLIRTVVRNFVNPNLLVTAGHAMPGCLSVAQTGMQQLRIGGGEGGGGGGVGGGGGGGGGYGEPEFAIWMLRRTVRNLGAHIACMTSRAHGLTGPVIAESVHETWFCGAGKQWSIPHLCYWLANHIFGHHLQECHIKAADTHKLLYYANRQLVLEGGAAIEPGQEAWCCSFVLVPPGDPQWCRKNVGQVFKMDSGDDRIDASTAKPGASTLLSGYQVLEGDGTATNPDCCVVGVALTSGGPMVWDAKAAAQVEIDTRNVPAYFWIEQQISRQIV